MKIYIHSIMTATAIFAGGVSAYSAEITYSNGKVSIHAANEPINQVLKELCSELGCKVTMPVFSKTVTISRVNAEPKTLFRELLHDYQHVMYWRDGSLGNGKMVDEVHILSRVGVSKEVEGAQPVFQPELEPVAETAVHAEPLDVIATGGKFEMSENLIGTEDEMEELKDALQDPSPDVRLAALDLLFSLGMEGGKQLIQSALGDSDPIVRDTAKEILETYDEVYPNQ